MKSLKKRVESSFTWNFIGQFGSEAISFILKLVLAKLLVPKQFGIVAVAITIITVFNLLKSLTTDSAFVRDHESNLKKAKNTFFYLSGILDIFIFISIFLSSTFIATFFTKTTPELTSSLSLMVKVLVLGQIFNIFTNVPRSMLVREVRFKEIKLSLIVGQILYTIIAIVMAYLGYGAWGIIIGQLVSIITRSIMMFLFSPFIPALIFSKKIAKKYLTFGASLFVSTLVGSIILEGDSVMIAHFLGVALLGIYHLAQQIIRTVVLGLHNIFESIMYPLIARYDHNKEKMKTIYLQFFEFSVVIVIPTLLGLVIVARNAVLLFLGENWVQIIPLIYVFTITVLIYLPTILAPSLFNAINKPQVSRDLSLIQLIEYIILIYPLIMWHGIMGVAYMTVIFAITALIYLSIKLIIEFKGFLSKSLNIFSKHLAYSTIMGLIVFLVGIKLPMNYYTLFLQVLVGFLVYLGILLLFDKQVLNNLKLFLKEKKII